MSKMRSAETELRQTRSEIKQLKKDVATARMECSIYRTRATQSEQQVSEWKARFDKLLERTPKESA